jgi:DNA polymerase I
MWIFDSYYKGCVELWSRERKLNRVSAAYPPSFYMYLKDPHAHWDMIEGLESRYRVEERSFKTIFGSYQGHRIFASRKVAEKIEIQTRHAAELYNVESDKISGIWPRKTSFPVETEMSPGSRPTSRFP